LACRSHVQRLAKSLYARVESIEALLRAAQLDVVPRHLGDQCDLHIATLFVRGLHLRHSGFDIAPDAAEPIDLPTGVEAGVVHLLSSIAEPRDGDTSLEFKGTRGGSDLRLAARGGDSALRPLP